MSEATTKDAPVPTTKTHASNSEPTPTTRETQLRWDDQKMITSFANVVNIQSTREQVDLFFGTNQTWNAANEKGLTIELSNRVILSPFAAKRLSIALNGVLKEYESRHGQLGIEG